MAGCSCSACVRGKSHDEAMLPELDEIEAATELLEGASAGSLEGILGELIADAAGDAGSPLEPEIAHRLSAVAHGLLRRTLPGAERALRAVGARGRRLAGQVFGIEVEGLSPEDMELATARQVVRFARAAAQAAARMPRRLPARLRSRRAALAAARRWAPGLLVHSRRGPAPQPLHLPASGTKKRRRAVLAARGAWVRSGRNIVVVC